MATSKQRLRRNFVWGAAVAVLLATAAVYWRENLGRGNQTAGTAHSVSDLSSLLALPVHALQQVELARLNLLCAVGLRGSENLDMNRSLAKLDEMAARVRSETERHYYRFQQNPAEFEHSEGFYRMLMLAVVLAEVFHVQYAPDKVGSAADAWTGDGFFANSRDVFLHGLTGAKPRGTCSSLPVLHAPGKSPANVWTMGGNFVPPACHSPQWAVPNSLDWNARLGKPLPTCGGFVSLAPASPPPTARRLAGKPRETDYS